MSAEAQILNNDELRALCALIQSQLNLGMSHLENADLKDLLMKIQYYGPEINIKSQNDEGELYILKFVSGARVPAIRALRMATGLGLKEAKDLSDRAEFNAVHHELILRLTQNQYSVLLSEANYNPSRYMSVAPYTGPQSARVAYSYR